MEKYDQSPVDLDILYEYEAIERFKAQIISVDLVFLSHYQALLSANDALTLQDLTKVKQKQFEKIQRMIEYIKILEEHQIIQTATLEPIFSNLKMLQIKQLKTQKAAGAYRKTKK